MIDTSNNTNNYQTIVNVPILLKEPLTSYVISNCYTKQIQLLLMFENYLLYINSMINIK